MIELRPYQLEAVELVRACVRRGIRRILLVLATGGGKTRIASHIMAAAAGNGKDSLFLAHRREIINQTYDKLLETGLEEADVGVIMGNDPRRRPGARIQVASSDTLRGRRKPCANIVFLDECHRALTRTNLDIAAAYPDAIHIGLTATPYRADGRGLEEAYDELVVGAQPGALVAGGYLCAPHVLSVPASQRPDLSAVRVRGGDYDERGLAEAFDRAQLVGNLVEHWQRHAQGRRTVVFAVSIEHSKHITERFVAAGVTAEHLDGTMETSVRDAILARLERGETRVVSNVNCLAEGWDQPSVKCLVLARPTKSQGLYLQQAGRILRPWRDPTTGEWVEALILDHAGCVVDHGLPQEERVFSLEGEERETRRGRKAKACESCETTVEPGTRICPKCGREFPVVELAMPEEVEATLVDVAETDLGRQRAVWTALCMEAVKSHYQAGWVFHRFKTKFGIAPPKAWRLPPALRAARDFTEAEKADYLATLQGLQKSRGYKPGYVYARYLAKFGVAPPGSPWRGPSTRLEPPVVRVAASAAPQAEDAPEGTFTPAVAIPVASPAAASPELVEWTL